MKSNIALIGFMGSGKSTVGRELAKRLERNFIEIDRLIEQQANMSIAEIFQSQGEQRFRDIEEDVIKTISGSAQNSVIACGGGVVVRQINIEQIKKSSRIVYLQTSAAILQERLARSRKRPLLERHDRKKAIEEMHTSRLPLYEASADIIINTGNRPFSAVIDEIIERLGIYESRHR